MLIAGIVLILLNVAALAPMATGAVEGAVEDNFASFSKDSACADADCTEAEEDWAVSTASRDFYGYSITNVADVMATGAEPTYEKIGPVTYDITLRQHCRRTDLQLGQVLCLFRRHRRPLRHRGQPGSTLPSKPGHWRHWLGHRRHHGHDQSRIHGRNDGNDLEHHPCR